MSASLMPKQRKSHQTQVGALQLGDHNSGEVLGEEVADILVVALDDLDELLQPLGAVAVGGLVGHGAEALDVHEGLEAHLLLGTWPAPRRWG